MASVGAFYLLQQKFVEHARNFLRVGVVAGIAASLWQCFPAAIYMASTWRATTSDHGSHGRLFKSQTGAPIVILGQPDQDISGSTIPSSPTSVELSYLRNDHAEVQG